MGLWPSTELIFFPHFPIELSDVILTVFEQRKEGRWKKKRKGGITQWEFYEN